MLGSERALPETALGNQGMAPGELLYPHSLILLLNDYHNSGTFFQENAFFWTRRLGHLGETLDVIK